MDETRSAHGHLLLGMRQLRDIVDMGSNKGGGGSKGAASSASLPAYASKYGVLHLAAAGPQAETLLDAGEGGKSVAPGANDHDPIVIPHYWQACCSVQLFCTDRLCRANGIDVAVHASSEHANQKRFGKRGIGPCSQWALQRTNGPCKRTLGNVSYCYHQPLSSGPSPGSSPSCVTIPPSPPPSSTAAPLSALSEWEYLRAVIRSGHGGALVKALGSIKLRTPYAEDATRWEGRALVKALRGNKQRTPHAKDATGRGAGPGVVGSITWDGGIRAAHGVRQS